MDLTSLHALKGTYSVTQTYLLRCKKKNHWNGYFVEVSLLKSQLCSDWGAITRQTHTFLGIPQILHACKPAFNTCIETHPQTPTRPSQLIYFNLVCSNIQTWNLWLTDCIQPTPPPSLLLSFFSSCLPPHRRLRQWGRSEWKGHRWGCMMKCVTFTWVYVVFYHLLANYGELLFGSCRLEGFIFVFESISDDFSDLSEPWRRKTFKSLVLWPDPLWTRTWAIALMCSTGFLAAINAVTVLLWDSCAVWLWNHHRATLMLWPSLHIYNHIRFTLDWHGKKVL